MITGFLPLLRRYLQPLLYAYERGFHLEKEELQQAKALLKARPQERQQTLADFLDHFAPDLSGERVAFANPAMALFAGLKALDLSPGKEVIYALQSPAWVSQAILAAGGVPIPSDMDDFTFGTSFACLQRRQSANTAVVILRHAHGIASPLQEIQAWAQAAQIKLVEDCTQSPDSQYQGKPLGSFGDLALFSLDYGNLFENSWGGILISAQPKLGQRLAKLRRDLPLPLPKQDQTLFGQIHLLSHYSHPQLRPKLDLILWVLEKLGRPSPFRNPLPISPATSLSPLLADLHRTRQSHWAAERKQRRGQLVRYIGLFSKSKLKSSIHPVYLEPEQSITPLGFIIACPEAPKIKALMATRFAMEGWPAPPELERGDWVFEVAEHRKEQMLYFPLPLPPGFEEKYWLRLEEILQEAGLLARP